MKTIYFVRHGESEANAARITAGGGLDVGLTQRGVDQAVQVGRMLKSKDIDLIVSSPQKRAFHTATAIAGEIGYSPENIVTSEWFVERHLGDMTGKPHDDVQVWFDMGIAPSGGESTEALHDRIVTGLQWLQGLNANKIVLVSHGGPGRMLRAIYRNEQHNSINSLGSVGNAQVLELSL
jgi:alpha-ribazole phosphatase